MLILKEEFEKKMVVQKEILGNICDDLIFCI